MQTQAASQLAASLGSRGLNSEGGLPDVNKPNFFSQRPKSGGDDGLAQQLMNLKAPQKGKLFKGTPFAYLKSSVEDKSRIQDLMVSYFIKFEYTYSLLWRRTISRFCFRSQKSEASRTRSLESQRREAVFLLIMACKIQTPLAICTPMQTHQGQSEEITLIWRDMPREAKTHCDYIEHL